MKKPGPKASAPMRYQNLQANLPADVAIRMPLPENGHCDISKEECRLWANIYDGIDIQAELKACCLWLLVNPGRASSESDIGRIVTNWLGNARGRHSNRETSEWNRQEADRRRMIDALLAKQNGDPEAWNDYCGDLSLAAGPVDSSDYEVGENGQLLRRDKPPRGDNNAWNSSASLASSMLARMRKAG